MIQNRLHSSRRACLTHARPILDSCFLCVSYQPRPLWTNPCRRCRVTAATGSVLGRNLPCWASQSPSEGGPGRPSQVPPGLAHGRRLLSWHGWQAGCTLKSVVPINCSDPSRDCHDGRVHLYLVHAPQVPLQALSQPQTRRASTCLSAQRYLIPPRGTLATPSCSESLSPFTSLHLTLGIPVLSYSPLPPFLHRTSISQPPQHTSPPHDQPSVLCINQISSAATRPPQPAINNHDNPTKSSP